MYSYQARVQREATTTSIRVSLMSEASSTLSMVMLLECKTLGTSSTGRCTGIAAAFTATNACDNFNSTSLHNVALNTYIHRTKISTCCEPTIHGFSCQSSLCGDSLIQRLKWFDHPIYRWVREPNITYVQGVTSGIGCLKNADGQLYIYIVDLSVRRLFVFTYSCQCVSNSISHFHLSTRRTRRKKTISLFFV